MRIKKGDTVQITKGKDRGKTGKVMQALPSISRVVVEGMNTAQKHMRARRRGENGQKISFASPVRIENVLLVCPKCAKPTRVMMKKLEDANGKSYNARQCKKCNEVIE